MGVLDWKVRWESKLRGLDGRVRWRACEELGEVLEQEGGDVQ